MREADTVSRSGQFYCGWAAHTCSLRKLAVHLFLSVAVTSMALMITSVACAQEEAPSKPITSSDQKSVIDSLGKQLKANYVFPGVATNIAASLERKLARGGYDEAKTTNDFARSLTADLQSLGKDLHLRAMYDPTFQPFSDEAIPTAQQLDVMKKHAEHAGFAIAKVEHLPGNVGYLDIRGFIHADFVAGAYASAMTLLSGTDALILDLRHNHGGDPAGVSALLSYFFAQGDDRHLNDLYWRAENRTQEFWTIPVVGPRYTKPVYVLTSNDTFSGGEECAYDFQTQKRATLVGDTTGGGANPGGVIPISHGFVAFIPTGRAINPITKTSWEHVGVKPDVPVPARDAMKTAYVSILKSLIPRTIDPYELDEIKSTLAKINKGEEGKSDFIPPGL